MHQIYCSTGSLLGRANGRNYRLLSEYCPQLDCDGFEFILYTVWYDEIERLTAFLKSLHLHIPVMHCEKTMAEHITKGGEEEWREHGLELLVENVVCRKDPMSHWVELYRHYPEIRFVFDTKMAEFHRQLDLIYQPEYDWLWREDHIRHYHVNDYGGGYMDWENLRVLPMGKGHIDFDRFFAHVGKTGYRGDFTFEGSGLDQAGGIHPDLLNRQFGQARKYIQNMNIRSEEEQV